MNSAPEIGIPAGSKDETINSMKNFIFGIYFLGSVMITLLAALDVFFGANFGYSVDDFYWGIAFIVWGFILYFTTGWAYRLMFGK